MVASATIEVAVVGGGGSVVAGASAVVGAGALVVVGATVVVVGNALTVVVDTDDAAEPSADELQLASTNAAKVPHAAVRRSCIRSNLKDDQSDNQEPFTHQ